MGICFSKIFNSNNKYEGYYILNAPKYKKEHQISVEMMCTYYK